ncbi:hypothetical protein Lalb_Chr16g0386041 [Lupinus albus]|uniref:Uncharacterized protein n=1 Tax=Lupinus albus TaxID=3870 RepID=A0A6A4P6L4_LUPAL|nr:hypothetical protein Lalb_Chr16g0386041 [Lupinus albus]
MKFLEGFVICLCIFSAFNVYDAPPLLCEMPSFIYAYGIWKSFVKTFQMPIGCCITDFSLL